MKQRLFLINTKTTKTVATFNHHKFRTVKERSHTILSQVPPIHNSLPKLIESSGVSKYSYEIFIHMNNFNCLYLYFWADTIF